MIIFSFKPVELGQFNLTEDAEKSVRSYYSKSGGELSKSLKCVMNRFNQLKI